MKPHLFIVCAALALAACGQAEAPKEEAPPAAQSLLEQIQAQSREQQLVTSFQHLVAYQQAHPDSTPPCRTVRGTESRGVIPDNVSPDSVYAAYKGSAVFSVQCGDNTSLAPLEPREHWLVVYAPGAAEVSIVNCAGTAGRDLCTRNVPTVEAEPAAPAAP
jgi:hypothetical protein